MTLTIIIPTMGRKTLRRAVSSVEAQTEPTDCIVIQDDNEEGASITRNKAIQETRTEWVGFCDDDDWLAPYYHEWLDQEYKDCDMVIFWMKHADGLIIPGHTVVDDLNYNWVGISFALKTKIARELPFKNMLAEDWDLIQRVKKAGYQVKIVPKVAYFIGD